MAPPGIIFLVTNLPQLMALPVAIYVATLILKSQLAVVPPTWALFVVYISSWPTALILFEHWHNWKVNRDAEAAGAVLPPSMKFSLPLGLDVLQQLQTDYRTRFLGVYSHIQIVGLTVQTIQYFQYR